MATTANFSVTDTAWTAILTSADGTAVIETLNHDIEFVYSDAAVAIGQVKGLSLPRTQLNPYGSMEVSKLVVDRPLASGVSLYARCTTVSGNATVVVFKDSEAFGS